jgi:hypothetical protein
MSFQATAHSGSLLKAELASAQFVVFVLGQSGDRVTGADEPLIATVAATLGRPDDPYCGIGRDLDGGLQVRGADAQHQLPLLATPVRPVTHSGRVDVLRTHDEFGCVGKVLGVGLEKGDVEKL